MCVCNHTPAKLALTRRLHTYLPFPVSERGSHLSLLPHLSLQNSGGTCLRLLRHIRQPRNCSWRLDSSERARLAGRLRRGIRAHGSSLLLLFFFSNRRKYFFSHFLQFLLRIQPPAQRLQHARGGTKGKKKAKKNVSQFPFSAGTTWRDRCGVGGLAPPWGPNVNRQECDTHHSRWFRGGCSLGVRSQRLQRNKGDETLSLPPPPAVSIRAHLEPPTPPAHQHSHSSFFFLLTNCHCPSTGCERNGNV